MSDNKIFQTTNEAKIKGYLQEIKYEVVPGNNGNSIRATLSVLDRDKNKINVQYYINEFKKGTSDLNSQYKQFDTFVNNVEIADEETEKKGSMVELSGCRISNNDYYSGDASNKIKDVRINGSFVNILKTADENDFIGAINFTGYIKSIIDEIKNDVPTGRVILKLVGINYNQAANEVDFVVEKEAVEGIRMIYNVGDTVNVDARIVSVEKIEEKVSAVAWGEANKDVRHIFKREFVAIGGQAPFQEGHPEKITKEKLEEAEQTRERIMMEALERSKRNNQQQQTMGFGGNAANFQQSVQNNNAFSMSGSTAPIPPNLVSGRTMF